MLPRRPRPAMLGLPQEDTMSSKGGPIPGSPAAEFQLDSARARLASKVGQAAAIIVATTPSSANGMSSPVGSLADNEERKGSSTAKGDDGIQQI